MSWLEGSKWAEDDDGDGLSEADVQALIDASLGTYATEAYVDISVNPVSLLVTDDDYDQVVGEFDVRMFVGTNKFINLLNTASWINTEYCYKNLGVSAGTVTINAFAGNIFDDATTTFVLSPGDFIRLKAQSGLTIDRR